MRIATNPGLGGAHRRLRRVHAWRGRTPSLESRPGDLIDRPRAPHGTSAGDRSARRRLWSRHDAGPARCGIADHVAVRVRAMPATPIGFGVSVPASSRVKVIAVAAGWGLIFAAAFPATGRRS